MLRIPVVQSVEHVSVTQRERFAIERTERGFHALRRFVIRARLRRLGADRAEQCQMPFRFRARRSSASSSSSDIGNERERRVIRVIRVLVVVLRLGVLLVRMRLAVRHERVRQQHQLAREDRIVAARVRSGRCSSVCGGHFGSRRGNWAQQRRARATRWRHHRCRCRRQQIRTACACAGAAREGCLHLQLRVHRFDLAWAEAAALHAVILHLLLHAREHELHLLRLRRWKALLAF